MAVTRLDSAAIVVFTLAGTLVFLAVLAYQTYIFLRHGIWAPVTLYSLADWVSPQLGAAITPINDWQGLRKVIEWFNGGFLVMVACLLIAAAFNSNPNTPK